VAVQALGIWLATRLVFILFTYIAVLFNTQGFDPVQMGLGGSFPPDALLDSWYKWDTAWYMGISKDGYAGEPLRAAFFPLYPFLVGLFSFWAGETTRLGIALLISNLGSLAAFIALGLLAAREKGASTVPYVIGALAAYPLSFFTAAAYPDSIFLALAAFSLFFARGGRWYWAACCAFLAALTRPTGVVLILPLLWEYASRHGWLSKRWREGLQARVVAKGAVVVMAVPLSLILFTLYLWSTYNNPLAFFEAQASWKHEFTPLWDIPALILGALQNQPAWSFTQARILVDVIPILVFAALTVVSARRLPVSFTLYMGGVLLLALASPLVSYFDPFASMGRYLLAAFPAYILMGSWMQRQVWVHILVMSGGFMLQAIFATFFLMGGWMV